MPEDVLLMNGKTDLLMSHTWSDICSIFITDGAKSIVILSEKTCKAYTVY